MVRSNFSGIRHEVLALSRGGMRQSVIAGCIGLTRATVNRLLRRHVALGTLLLGKSRGAPRKTTPRQDRALFRQDRFISVRALTTQMRNLFGMRAGWRTINNRLLSHGYHASRPTRKSSLTANHHRHCLEWVQRWHNLTLTHWRHVIFGDESRFQL